MINQSLVEPELSIAFIGGGNMASAMIGGILKKPSHVKLQVVEPSSSQRELLQTQYELDDVFESSLELKPANILVLAIKPQLMQQVCNQLSQLAWVSESLIISIAAGTTIERIAQWLENKTNRKAIRLIRTMPNTPALVGLGITGLVASKNASESDKQTATTIMRTVGSTVWFDDEASLNAVTALSGSGPAYVFYLLEAFQSAGQKIGLTTTQARQLAIETFVGASVLAQSSPDSFSKLREKVTSKGGTTAAALNVMNERGMNEIFSTAISAAYQRSIELGSIQIAANEP